MIEQRTEAWYEARRGKPTASGFSKVLTSKLEPSKQAQTYMNELMLERLGRPIKQFFENEAMRIGTAREPQGVAAFEIVTGIDTREAGFMVSKCGRFGASPDRIWDDGVLELKCPLLTTHEKYLKASLTPSKYLLQLRGQMVIADVPFGYFCSYHPDSQPLVVKIERDPEWEALFLAGMDSFLQELDKRYSIACKNILN